MYDICFSMFFHFLHFLLFSLLPLFIPNSFQLANLPRTMATIKNDGQKNSVWHQLKTKLHSTMVAFGSGSVQLPKLMDTFRADWGSELTSYAIQLGFGCNDGAVYKMLLTMPDEIESGFVSATGTFAFKVVPKAETSENLTKIDESNRYQNERRKGLAQRRFSLSNSNGFHQSRRPNDTFRAQQLAKPSPSPFALSAPNPKASCFNRLTVQLLNHANAQRRVSPSTSNGLHQPLRSNDLAKPSPSPFTLSGSNAKPSRVSGLTVQLPNHANALRRVSLTVSNGGHQPRRANDLAKPTPSPFTLSGQNPKPSRVPELTVVVDELELLIERFKRLKLTD